MTKKRSFLARVAKIDQLIAAGPSAVAYDRDLADLLSDDSLNEYFFTHLSDPAWLPVLVEAQRFKKLPAPKTLAQKNETLIRFPFWLEGEYLKKLAAVQPKAVCDVLMALPTTRNTRVYDAILEIALMCGPQQSIQLVPKIVEGIRSPYHLLFPYKLGGFISGLAEIGEREAALHLTAVALELRPQKKRKAQSDIGS